MPSTVIASAYGPATWLLPLARPPIDEGRLDLVLAKHGLTLLPGSASSVEFVAGTDLSAQSAAALAEDLRALGLVVRVVPRGELRWSTRIGVVFLGYFMAAMGGMLVLQAGIAMMAKGMGGTGALVLAVGAFLMAMSVINAVVVQARGGQALPLAGAAPEEGGGIAGVVASVRRLAGSLPDHVGRPLVDQVRVLESRARANPEGEAARELRELAAELGEVCDEADAEAVRDLRADLMRTRQAMREAQGRSTR